MDKKSKVCMSVLLGICNTLYSVFDLVEFYLGNW